MDKDIAKLFGPEWNEAFDAGQAVRLIEDRNRNLGVLLSCEQAAYYIQILYRMLIFRREHEIEPLNDDIYRAVKTAQEQLEGEAYPPERFNQQMTQLLEWQLVRRRIEKERLRGYRDAGRHKFRYALEEDAVALLLWLEDRLRSGDGESTDDTRNLLADALGRLRNVLRELDLADPAAADENSLAHLRQLLYNFGQLDVLSGLISRRLIGLNADLSAFLVSSYNIEAARQVIVELEFYFRVYLRQLNETREEILGVIKLLGEANRRTRLNECRITADEDLERISWLRPGLAAETPERLLARLEIFYANGGQLDGLCHRINDSVMKVWGKMSAHLRELERKNTRLENLRNRMKEIAGLPENAVPESFLLELLAPAHLVGDKQYWDEFEKANPPQPRREVGVRRPTPGGYLGQKHGHGSPVQSLEESRLERLQRWVAEKYRFNAAGKVDLAGVEVEAVDDFMRLLELGRRGILSEGKSLEKLDYRLETGAGMCEVTAPDGCKLQFMEMKLVELKNGKNA